MFAIKINSKLIAGNGISGVLVFKISRGRMPSDPSTELAPSALVCSAHQLLIRSYASGSDYVFAAHFTALLSVNYKFQPKTVAFILKSDHSFLQAWIVQTLYSNIVINSRPISQKSISV